MQSEREQLAFLHSCYAMADKRNQGYLTSHDLKCGVAAALGIRASKLLLAQMFQVENVSNHEFRVSKDKFVQVMMKRLAKKTDLMEDIRKLFMAMDLQAEGFISIRSFQQVCEMTLPLGNHERLLRAFHEADRDNDGRVTYQDFERMCLLAVEVNASRNL